jgi:hypothetical protein
MEAPALQHMVQMESGFIKAAPTSAVHCYVAHHVQVLGDAKGKVTYGVTSVTEANGRLFMGTIRRSGVPVLDVKDIQ